MSLEKHSNPLFKLVLLGLIALLMSAACSNTLITGDAQPTLNVVESVGLAQTGTAFVKAVPTLTPAVFQGADPTSAAGFNSNPAPALPQATLLPNPTATLTPLPSVTPTPALHPMMIAAGRMTPYPGSDITIVNPLDPGINYSRYYASYESEGLTIYGLLTIPNDPMPAGGFPAIVFNHGYIAPEVYRTTERYIAYVDWLARSGYVVYRIDYRGHDQSEGDPAGAYSDPGYTADVLNALAALKRFPQVNPERIGMWGHSMGGYLTLRAMVISPEIRAGVIWAGVVGSYPDLLNRWRRRGAETSTPVPSSGSRRWRNAWVEEYGAPEENPEFWNSISANAYLADISGPIQLHHGTLDESVPLELSQLLYEEMNNAGKPVEFYIYEGDNHNLSNYFNDAMTRTLQFFETHLKAGL